MQFAEIDGEIVWWLDPDEVLPPMTDEDQEYDRAYLEDEARRHRAWGRRTSTGGYYVPDGRRVGPREHMRNMQVDRCIGRDRYRGNGGERIRVQTDFMGTNMRVFGDGPPLIWETMVFGGPLADHQVRYATRDEALAGHRQVSQLVKLTATRAARARVRRVRLQLQQVERRAARRRRRRTGRTARRSSGKP